MIEKVHLDDLDLYVITFIALKLVELNFLVSFNTDDQSKTDVANAINVITYLILSIVTCHAEKVGAQMDGGRRLWASLYKSKRNMVNLPNVQHSKINIKKYITGDTKVENNTDGTFKLTTTLWKTFQREDYGRTFRCVVQPQSGRGRKEIANRKISVHCEFCF